MKWDGSARPASVLRTAMACWVLNGLTGPGWEDKYALLNEHTIQSEKGILWKQSCNQCTAHSHGLRVLNGLTGHNPKDKYALLNEIQLKGRKISSKFPKLMTNLDVKNIEMNWYAWILERNYEQNGRSTCKKKER